MNDLTIETHPLPAFLPHNGKLLMLGSFPPPKNRWKMDFYYPNYQNDMWRIFGICFFQDKDYFVDLIHKNFHLNKIMDFLNEKGIGIYDTAYQVTRLTGNASDKFLKIESLSDIKLLLASMPDCQSVMTTGDKATDTLMLSMPENSIKPKIGQSSHIHFEQRDLILYRMPSSSRAYPLALEKKAQAYQKLFKELALL